MNTIQTPDQTKLFVNVTNTFRCPDDSKNWSINKSNVARFIFWWLAWRLITGRDIEGLLWRLSRPVVAHIDPIHKGNSFGPALEEQSGTYSRATVFTSFPLSLILCSTHKLTLISNVATESAQSNSCNYSVTMYKVLQTQLSLYKTILRYTQQ